MPDAIKEWERPWKPMPSFGSGGDHRESDPAALAPPPLRQSQMSAKAKSEFIEARKAEGLSGEELQRAYYSLPW
jgi:hypothetical protein